MKKSMVLLELIVSLLLFSILAISSSKMAFLLIKQNKESTFIVQNNLILETTRLFFIKHIDYAQYSRVGSKLYFNNNLLLEHISKFELNDLGTTRTVNICIYKNSICQVWKIKI